MVAILYALYRIEFLKGKEDKVGVERERNQIIAAFVKLIPINNRIRERKGGKPFPPPANGRKKSGLTAN